MTKVYKIISAADHGGAVATGAAPLAAVDLADGYVHLSADDQALETARRHFAGRDDLVVLAFDADALGPALRWERSRDGALFPHFYGRLSMAMASEARRLVRREDGSFAFGALIA